MFTGIVEELGIVAVAGNRLRVQCSKVLEDSSVGSSIAVNGVCLTAVEIEPDGFWVDLAPETIERTNLGDLREASLVNLERPVAVGERLSGHIVQGHVDGTADFVSLEPLPDENWWLKIRVPADLERYMIHKGSVALDGISLTIAALKHSTLAVAIIPHTYANTTVRCYGPGARINVEVDMIAKYVEKLAAAGIPASA
jgi:riboflavin synthase